MGAWQKHMLSFQATWPLASCMASGRLHTDGMYCKKKMILCSVSKLRDLSKYLTKTPFQLHVNCKLHNILMCLHLEFDSCNYSGVGIISHEETSENCAFLCFAVHEGKILLTLFVTTLFHLLTGKRIQLPVGTWWLIKLEG